MLYFSVNARTMRFLKELFFALLQHESDLMKWVGLVSLLIISQTCFFV